MHCSARSVVFALLFHSAIGCTTIVVGRKASKDGSVFVTHSDDGESKNDARLCRVPARDFAPGSQRPVYYWRDTYPRYVGHDRCSIYNPIHGQAVDQPIGYIPQVPHTYAYYDSTSGLLNEHGLAMGESTCSAVFVSNASGHGGHALFTFDELSRVAMERTKTARSAVELMGSLAEEHGFYGAGTFEGSGESLIVGDANEAWIFHILPDPSGKSAIWAAQRVPDDHVGVVANMFVIRDVVLDDPSNFLYSKSALTVASERGWWNPGRGGFDFTRIYSDGEYSQKFYSGRRMWRVYGLFGVALPDDYGDLRHDSVYPATSRPVQRSITARSLFSAHRDYFEGTKYDMTNGLASGPWGNPDRWTTSSKAVKGSWERSIALFRTTATHVAQVRQSGQGAILWFGPHASAGTCFFPMPAGLPAVPEPYEVANPDVLSRGSSYWAHKFVFNVAHLKYRYAIQDVKALQDQLEQRSEDLVKTLDSRCSGTCDKSQLSFAYDRHAGDVAQAFWNLSSVLVAKYADGFLNDRAPLGYPDWWLRAVGYENGPPPPSTSVEIDCNDAQVQHCTAKCPLNGFAQCTSSCLVSARTRCSPPHAVVV